MSETIGDLQRRCAELLARCATLKSVADAAVAYRDAERAQHEARVRFYETLIVTTDGYAMDRAEKKRFAAREALDAAIVALTQERP